MKKNIIKKFIVLLSLGFVLFGFNFTNVTAEDVVTPAPLECVAPQILNEAQDACIDVVVVPEVLTCVLPQVLNETNDACIDPVPEVIVCEEPQVEVAGVCTTPVVEPTPDPVPENTIHDVVVKNGCTVKDTEGVDHIFPEENSTSEFLGVCALVSAKDAGYINDFELVNDPSFGLYLSSINGEKPSSTEYWALYLNDGYASCGIGCLPVSINDKLSFVLTDWMAGTESTKILLRISSLESTPVTPPAPVYHDIVVKDNCTVTDTVGVSHVFENGEIKFLGVCALVAAKEAGYINSFELVDDPSMGLYLKNVNATTLGSSEYWALWLNGGFANCGVGCLPVAVGDKLDLVLTDWMTSVESTKILLRISSLESTPVTPPAPTGGAGGSGSNTVSDKEFSIENAFNFLIQNKKSDGSYGDSMYTDWVAVAASAGDNSNLKSSLVNYLKSNPINTNVVTDYERHAMALMALGINPYDGTDINYIKKIVDSFDGVQFGDKDLVNDDIFALLVLKDAGYSATDEIIYKDIEYILSKQSGGSWGSIDMTGAGIQALRGLESIEGVASAISNGELYLISNQKEDSGFENSFSTSWALQALFTNSSIIKAENYLANKQQIDGGLENITDSIDTRVWATAYAIPAVLHKSWSEILNNFSKQIITSPQSTSSSEVKEEIKKDIVAPVILAEENSDKKALQKLEIKTVNKNLTKTNAAKNTKVARTESEEIKEKTEESNPLSASAIGSTGSNNGFFSVIHNLIAKIKAPFVWFLIKLGF